MSELAEHVGSRVSAQVLTILGEPVLILANAALDADIWRAKQDGPGDETTSPCVNSSTSQEREPVKVVEPPEAAHDLRAGNAALFPRRVDSNNVDETGLEPGSIGVSMSVACLMLVPVIVGHIRVFRLVGESVTPVILQQVLIVVTELLLQVN